MSQCLSLLISEVSVCLSEDRNAEYEDLDYPVFRSLVHPHIVYVYPDYAQIFPNKLLYIHNSLFYNSCPAGSRSQMPFLQGLGPPSFRLPSVCPAAVRHAGCLHCICHFYHGIPSPVRACRVPMLSRLSAWPCIHSCPARGVPNALCGFAVPGGSNPRACLCTPPVFPGRHS